MDRALKERIIGAVVLVLFAILVVPVFLDGPSDDPEIVSEPVSLPGQNDQERTQKTIVLERDRTEPIPSGGANSPTQAVVQATSDQSSPAEASSEAADEAPPEPEPVQVASTSVDEPDKEATEAIDNPIPATESATGMWAVQLGSFSNEENADRLAADLRKQGFAAFLSQLQTASGELHRVRVGPQKDRDSAEAVAATLQRNGHRSQVVPHP